MIEISAIIPWSFAERPAGSPHVIRELHVTSPNRRRLVEFYARVFGFRAIAPVRDGAPAILPATDRSDLIVHGHEWLQPRTAGFLHRWAFVVADLDAVREAAWDLGIAAARDSGDPDYIYRRRHGRSFYVHDPDGHEIELVELWTQLEQRGRRSADLGERWAALQAAG